MTKSPEEVKRMYLHQLVTPAQIKAGSVGEKRVPFYHDCADCGAKEPLIHGYLSSSTEQCTSTIDLTFGVIKKGVFFSLAVFCKDCFEKRLTEAKK